MRNYEPEDLANGNYATIAKRTGILTDLPGGRRRASNLNWDSEVRPLSRQHVSRVLRGKIGYSDDSIMRIAWALGVEVEWLANYVGKVVSNGGSDDR